MPAGITQAMAVPSRITIAGNKITSEAIFISKASSFLPRYSGVRPTIRPPMKTATIAKASMP